MVAFDHAYHGRTNLTMALTAKNMPYKQGFGPFAPEVYRMPMAYPYRWPTGPEQCGPEALAAVTGAIDTQVGAGNVACVVIEPIQGEGGFVVPAPGFLAGLAEYCRRNGIVFVADEVQTGFARTGDWFACEHEGVVPDLVTTAKGIAGGLPLAAVTGRAEIMDAVHTGGLGGTYGGNPLACAAALGAIRTIEEQDLCGAARRIEATMLPRLRALQDRCPAVGDVGAGARWSPSSWCSPARPPPTRRPPRGRGGLPPGRGGGADLRHLRQRAALPAAAGHPGPPARRGAHRSSRRRSRVFLT